MGDCDGQGLYLALNRARLALDFPSEAELLAANAGIPSETDQVVLSSGMKVLTCNALC